MKQKSEWRIEEEKAEQKAKLANCYWYDTKPCDDCQDRFKCHTMRLKPFNITVYFSGWREQRVYAETKEEAEELYEDYLGNEQIIEEFRDGETNDDSTEVEEVTDMKPQRKTTRRKK